MVTQVVTGDWFTPLQEFKGRLSGILSNPPYIPSSSVPVLQVWGCLSCCRDSLDMQDVESVLHSFLCVFAG